MRWQVLVDGRTVEIAKKQLQQARQVEPGVYSLLIDGKSVEVRVVPGEQGSTVVAGGRRFAVEVRDPRNASRGSRGALGGGRQKVVAPMPGKVIRVLVQKGDAVEPGQGLVVVEAMKMQNEMKASHPGHVTEVRVHDGDTVGAGETLVVLE
jgi:biotin carboxyl carrier protein